jgi:hypothetical protein
VNGLLGRIALRAAGLAAGPAASTPLRPPVGWEPEGGESVELVEEAVVPAPASSPPAHASKPLPARESLPSPARPEVSVPKPAEPPAAAPRPADTIPVEPPAAAPRAYRAPVERAPDQAPVRPSPPVKVDASVPSEPPTQAFVNRLPSEVPSRGASTPTAGRRQPASPAELPSPPQPQRVVRRTIVEQVQTPRPIRTVPPVAPRREPAERGEAERERVSPEPVPGPHSLERVPQPEAAVEDRHEASDPSDSPEPTTAVALVDEVAPDRDVEITIGTIEVQLAPESPSEGPSSRRLEPEGFGAYAGVR